MKLTKSEKCAIILCLLFLALALGFAMGHKKQDSVFVITESSFTAEREVPAVTGGEEAAEQTVVNINTSGAAELETLKGIGPVLAQRIIEYRETEGGFRSIEDITKVRGIGAAVFEDIRGYITVE